MAYSITQWEYSDATEVSEDRIPEGWRTIKILSATKFEDPNGDVVKDRFNMMIEDVQTKATSPLGYFLMKRDGDGNPVKNGYSLGTLRTLGQALFDQKVIPAPQDVVGGVVRAEVKYNTSKTTGRQYLNIYTFAPAEETYVLSYSDIEQFYIPDGSVDDGVGGAQ